MAQVRQPQALSAGEGEYLFRSYWFDRFKVFQQGGICRFLDHLQPTAGARLPADVFAALGERERDVAFFQKGFMTPCLSVFPKPIDDRPRSEDDLLFWQFPCRTEGAAHELHARQRDVPFLDGGLHCYAGLPWATFIDKKRMDETQLQVFRVRLSGLRHALRELGVALRVHTVCQHIYWRELAPLWESLGITDVWVSHMLASPVAGDELLPFRVHPWHLFAVNVEDVERRSGLLTDKDPGDKCYLATFIGAHMDHYLSDVRLRLRELANEPGFHVRVHGKWHFEDVVYQHQVRNAALAESYRIDRSVTEYNEVLSESRFALCPAGAGPNTLRLWEALAVGAVPVLLGPAPRLPEGGTLESIDWDRIVIRVTDEQIGSLPVILRSIPLDEVRHRQRMAMAAYAKVREQRCF